MAGLFTNKTSILRQAVGALQGRAVLLEGPFAEIGHRELQELVSEHGGILVGSLDEADSVVVGGRADAGRVQSLRESVGRLGLEFLTESMFLQRVIESDQGPGVHGLHSLPGVASALGVPIAAVRLWWRRGYLRPTRRIGRLPLFDWREVQVAKLLSRLLAAGRTLSQIGTLVNDLERRLPGVDRPLISPDIAVRADRFVLLSGGRLTEPGGQIVMDFEGASSRSDGTFWGGDDADHRAVTLPVRVEEPAADSLRDEAWRLADRGEHAAAIEACRLVLLSPDASADDHYLLANLLYEAGDHAAARERYYAAVERDPGFAEARVSLGCLLAESGDGRLAAAVLRGAVETDPDLAEAWFHLAAVLDEGREPGEAEACWRRFLELSPTGVWADHARDRLAEA